MNLLIYLVIFLVTICAPLVAFSKNAVQSVLSFVVVVIAICLLFFRANISYLTLVILFTYLNAIVILILFVILMLKINTDYSQELRISDDESVFYKVFLVFIFIFFIKIIFYVRQYLSLFLVGLLHQSREYNHSLEINSSILVDYDYFIFRYIFQDAWLEFLLLGCVLLFVMIGAVMLCIDDK